MNIVLTGSTASALDTFGFMIHEMWGWMTRFRIMVPKTFQGTAFQKYSGPYTGTIMHAKTLDIGDEILQHMPPCVVFSMTMSCHSLFRVTNLAFQPDTRTDSD